MLNPKSTGDIMKKYNDVKNVVSMLGCEETKEALKTIQSVCKYQDLFVNQWYYSGKIYFMIDNDNILKIER